MKNSCIINSVMTGNELKIKRKELGMTQEQLASALELSVFTVSKWEQQKELEIPNSKMVEFALSGLQVSLKKNQNEQRLSLAFA